MIARLKRQIFNSKGAEFSFAQAAEDLVLRRIFMGVPTGLFVDIGAYHPYRFSNTYLFYLSGWRGINIEARPGSKKIFDKIRPEDINLEMGVAQNPGSASYYMFAENTLNRFEFSDASAGEAQPSHVVGVEVKPLSQIFQDHLGSQRNIDFMTIDTEGAEEQVLRSNDWERYPANVVLLEQNRNNKRYCNAADLLKGLGYTERYRLPVNQDADSVFFIGKEYA